MATAALAPPPQETPPSSEGSPQAAALAAAARGTPTEHHRRGRTSCDRGTSSHVYAPPPQAAAPSVATCGTSSEHQQSIISTSADHHQQDISRTSAEHQQNVSRTSAEHHQNISSGTGAAAPGAAALAHAAHQNHGVRRPSKSGGRKGLGGTACLRVPCTEPQIAGASAVTQLLLENASLIIFSTFRRSRLSRMPDPFHAGARKKKGRW